VRVRLRVWNPLIKDAPKFSSIWHENLADKIADWQGKQKEWACLFIDSCRCRFFHLLKIEGDMKERVLWW
jgi:hypothetical protein